MGVHRKSSSKHRSQTYSTNSTSPLSGTKGLKTCYKVALALVLTVVTFIVVAVYIFCLLPRFIDWPTQNYPDTWMESVYAGPFTRNEAWVNEHMYKVATYKQVDDGLYHVTLLKIEEPTEATFEELCATFEDATYSIVNTATLSDGVNCQGMTYYIIKWCEKNGVQYAVDYYPAHVNVNVFIDDTWYLMDFTENRKIVPLNTDSEGNK